jgi:DNA-binding response OmpR family regulator
MGIIWVIERDTPSHTSAARALCGDFPVRRIASWENFRRVVRCDRKSIAPDLIVMDMDVAETSLVTTDAGIRAAFPDALRVYLCASESSRPDAAPAATRDTPTLFFFAKPIDTFQLSTFCRQILGAANVDEDVSDDLLTFRDVCLDTKRFTMGILPDEPRTQLPPKEARLLSLLMEKPGSCLSRADIRAAIWGETAVTPRTIDSHISRLRQRLQESETTIESVYGDGYMLR